MRSVFIQCFAICVLFFWGNAAFAVPPEDLIDLSSPVVATIGEIEFRECVVEAHARDRTLQCAWYEVPENYAEPAGKKIKIFIARIPASKPKKILQPMLFLEGGPGGAASQGYLQIDKVFRDLVKHRDFYLLDQRGTGHSNSLGCGDLVKDEEILLTQDNPALLRKLLLKCLQGLPGNPRFYTTSVAIKDFEQIREALNVKQWNLFGVSYGTRVALHYMRKHPASIRTATLDSIVPPRLALGADVAPNSQKILSWLYKRCVQNVECDTNFPDLADEVENLFSRLKKSPVEIKVENFSTGELEDTVFTYAHLTGLVRLYLYSPTTLSLLPPMLYEAAAKNNYAPLVRASNSVFSSVENALSLGMHNSVICTEDYPFFQSNKNNQDENTNTYMGTKFLEDIRTICEVWPQGIIDADFKEKLISDIPTLLFSGEYDPITPADYAERVLQGLSRAKHWVLKGQGHFASTGGCTPHIVEKFVNDASVDWLDGSCLDRLGTAPLFINFNGPSP